MVTSAAFPWLKLQPVAQPGDSILPDEQLALSLQHGQTEALSALVQRHHGPLLGYLYRLCGADRALAEDLVQETFLRVIRNLNQYRHPRPFKPWLYAIATNLARDHYKSADTRRTDVLDEGESIALATDLSVGEDARPIAQALAQIPVGQREVVILRYYQDLSLNEIAEALRIPVGTVKSRLSLGLGRLRTLLEEIP